MTPDTPTETARADPPLVVLSSVRARFGCGAASNSVSTVPPSLDERRSPRHSTRFVSDDARFPLAFNTAVRADRLGGPSPEPLLLVPGGTNR